VIKRIIKFLLFTVSFAGLLAYLFSMSWLVVFVLLLLTLLIGGWYADSDW
jgi:hypothetical protein